MSADELKRAWAELCDLMRPAAVFGRKRFRGSGEILGWWPTRPGHEALDTDFRVAWLRHELFQPLRPRQVAKLEEQVGRPLPRILRQFFVECSNGLNFATGDLTIYGFRRGSGHEPWELYLESAEHPPDAEPNHFFFGSWGGERHLIYLDEQDESVHVASLSSMQPLRSWPTFPQFLVRASEEHLASFDETGRRIGEAPLPPEVAREDARTTVPLRVAAGLQSRADEVRDMLRDAPRRLTLGDAVFDLAEPDQLGSAQIGYSVAPAGDDLTSGEGAWKPEWLVIGSEEDLGDPLFVDLASPELTVLTAEHGAGVWDPVEMARGLRGVLERGYDTA